MSEEFDKLSRIREAISSGSASALDILERTVDGWIAAQKAK